jgi:DinB superfamily
VAESESFAASFVSLYAQIHISLREEIAGLDRLALGWTPGPDTNSISTIVVHLLGSEVEVLRIVRGHPSDRDRISEFSMPTQGSSELLARIDEGDRLLEELGSGITDQDLAVERIRPGALRNRMPRTGLFWLLNSYGHAREHVSQLRLTKQLWEQHHSLHPGT